jgi:hypothetical protein
MKRETPFSLSKFHLLSPFLSATYANCELLSLSAGKLCPPHSLCYLYKLGFDVTISLLQI